MLKVLCLDIEGGYGGSSRSLFQSLSYLPDNAVQPEVWCRRAGPIQEQYSSAGIPCSVTPTMPHLNALPRFSRNLNVFAQAAIRFPASRVFRDKLSTALNERFDIIHFNHSALFLLARWLRHRTQAPFTMHIRSMPVPSAFSRWQARSIARVVDHAIFITENEQRTWKAVGLDPARESVIYNIADAPTLTADPHPAIPNDSRLKIVNLSNYAWIRGVDRLVEVAVALAARGRRDILFVVAGEMRLPGSLPGQLGKLARQGGKSLADYAAVRGVADMFLFLGHVSEPERVLAGCHVLARLSREDNPWGRDLFEIFGLARGRRGAGGNPWGRDVLEALGAGRPVVATGAYNRFVESGATGILLPKFSAGEVAETMLQLADDRALVNRLGAAAQARITTLCDGRARAADLAAVWMEVARE